MKTLRRMLAGAMLAGAALSVLATSANAAAPRMLDPAIPADALEISKRVQCGEADGQPAVYHCRASSIRASTANPTVSCSGSRG